MLSCSTLTYLQVELASKTEGPAELWLQESNMRHITKGGGKAFTQIVSYTRDLYIWRTTYFIWALQDEAYYWRNMFP